MTRERVGARAVYGAPPAPSCANCGRVVHVLDYRVGSVHFCSPMCRDTAKELRKHEQQKAHPEATCAWCGARTIEPITVTGTRHDGLFCSHRCIDKADAAQRCGTHGCFVCSGAMRERKGDPNG